MPTHEFSSIFGNTKERVISQIITRFPQFLHHVLSIIPNHLVQCQIRLTEHLTVPEEYDKLQTRLICSTINNSIPVHCTLLSICFLNIHFNLCDFKNSCQY
jgi:hypothetical protein